MINQDENCLNNLKLFKKYLTEIEVSDDWKFESSNYKTKWWKKSETEKDINWRKGCGDAYLEYLISLNNSLGVVELHFNLEVLETPYVYLRAFSNKMKPICEIDYYLIGKKKLSLLEKQFFNINTAFSYKNRFFRAFVYYDEVNSFKLNIRIIK